MINWYPAVGCALAVVAMLGIRRGRDHQPSGLLAKIPRWILPPLIAGVAAWYFLGATVWGIVAFAGTVIGRFIARRLNKGSNSGAGEPATRSNGALLFAAAVFAVAAFVPLQDLLGAWVTASWGTATLVIFDLALAFAIYWEWLHLHGHHAFWTSAACFCGGIAAFTTYADVDAVIRQGGRILPSTQASLNRAATQIGSGRAAQAAQSLPGVHHSNILPIAGGVIIGLLILVFIGGHRWAVSTHKRIRAAEARMGGPAGLPGGGRRAIG